MSGGKREKDNGTEGLLWVREFDEHAAEKFVSRVFTLADEDPDRPIVVWIDSFGGEVDALASMVSAFDAIENDVITVCMGKAMSCGAILLAEGDRRYVSPHGRVMIHEMYGGVTGTVANMRADVEEFTRMQEYWDRRMAKNCKQSLTGFRKHFTNKKQDLYLSPRAALKFGVADYIGVPVVKTFDKVQHLVA